MKKGFTLIELLGVIVILSIFAIIITVGIDSALSKGKKDLYDNQIAIIELSAKDWIKDNAELMEDDEPLFITIQRLIDDGYLESNIINPRTGEELNKFLQIKITKTANTYKTEVID